MSKKKPSQIDRLFPQAVIDRLLVGITQGELLRMQQRLVFEDIPAESIKAMLIGKETKESKDLLSLLGCILSPGDKARALLKIGYKLTKSSAQKSDDGTLWSVVKIERQSDVDASIPKRAREIYRTEKKCYLTLERIDERTMQIDHRSPVSTTGGYSHGKHATDEVLRECYMPVSASGNTWKREACRKCQLTGTRPGGEKSQIPFWHVGSSKFEQPVGCNGCFMHDPVKWREALHAVHTAQS